MFGVDDGVTEGNGVFPLIIVTELSSLSILIVDEKLFELSVSSLSAEPDPELLHVELSDTDPASFSAWAVQVRAYE